jgi:glycosyltransferase involved in cell wall biosynthesis
MTAHFPAEALVPEQARAASGDAGALAHRYCFLVAPGGQPGGGMGRVSDYLLQAAQADAGLPRYVAIDPRGPGRVIWSPFYVGRALAQIALGAWRKDAALAHVNVGDRGSLWRKGLLIRFARAFRLPVVLHLHATQLIAYYAGLPAIMKRVVHEIFSSATCCVVLGKAWRDFLVQEIGIDAGRVVILYNGVPRALNPRQEGDARCLRILFLGNLMERKGVSDLLEALALEPMSGFEWRATLAGGGPIDMYRHKADRLGLGSRIEFPGWVDQHQAGRLLAASDVLVLPSYDEGLPLVILEALTAGVPVVCTPVGAIPEVLEHEKTALFVQPGDAEGLAAALSRLGRDPDLRVNLAREGTELYEREFSLETFGARVAAIYRMYCFGGHSLQRS